VISGGALGRDPIAYRLDVIFWHGRATSRHSAKRSSRSPNIASERRARFYGFDQSGILRIVRTVIVFLDELLTED
jgi:hypothetical protein